MKFNGHNNSDGVRVATLKLTRNRKTILHPFIWVQENCGEWSRAQFRGKFLGKTVTIMILDGFGNTLGGVLTGSMKVRKTFEYSLMVGQIFFPQVNQAIVMANTSTMTSEGFYWVKIRTDLSLYIFSRSCIVS